MKRYRVGEFVEPPIEESDGGWVRYSDHVAALVTVRREEREAALEIVKRLTPPSNRLAQMFHKRVIATLEASASEKGEMNDPTN